MKKLGIKEENSVLLRNVPAALPEDLKGYSKSRHKDRLDVLILFTKFCAEVKAEFAAYRNSISTDGMIWVAWPKRASGVQTDLTENVIRDAALKTSFVDVKVCAIDEIWSGLKLVVRKEHRKAFVPKTQ